MKIQSTGSAPKVGTSQDGSPRKAKIGGMRSEPAAKVSMSPEGAFVTSLVEESKADSGIRQSLVDEVKAQLADGTFEASIDMNTMLDSLLADL